MPRRRPAQVRSTDRRAPTVTARGLPEHTARALDLLDQRELHSDRVADALAEWRTVVQLPVNVLWGPHNDWTEFVGPFARTVLDDAVHALDRRTGAPLRAELRVLDGEFARKTSNNPFADPTLPWWARRWWH